MVSIIIAAGISLIISLGIGHSFGKHDTWDGFWTGIFTFACCGMFSFFIILVIGVFAAPVLEYKNYEIVGYGDKAFCIRDGVLEEMNNNLKVVGDFNIKVPMYRIVHYDNSVFVRTDTYEIVIPSNKLELDLKE